MTPAVRSFKNQNFLELKTECVKNGRLFEDPEFPATDESLFYSKAPPHSIEWKRPEELCNDPYLFVEGISHHDLHQGQLGNCWFVAACSCLTLHQALWKKVIPNWKKQEWDPKRPHKYAGIFHFHFWCLGDWVDVVIDDRLPSTDGNLIYCHSNVKNEFWCALLEKAYAKLSGSYESLDGGSTADAIVDFTGAVVENIDLTNDKYSVNVAVQTKLFEELLKVHRGSGLICSHLKRETLAQDKILQKCLAWILKVVQHEPNAPSYSDREKVTPLGLVKGHAYSLTSIKKVTLGEKTLCFGKTTKLFMVRMRNPWGKREWRGAWNDDSEEWNKVSRSEKEKLGLTVRNDGEFWMTFEDWCKNFSSADVCHVINTSLLSQHKTWEKGEACGKWTVNADALLNRSGGCFNNKNTFLQNPQTSRAYFTSTLQSIHCEATPTLLAKPPVVRHVVHYTADIFLLDTFEYIFEVEKEEDEVLVSIQQEDQRIHRKSGKGDSFLIGFEILKVYPEDLQRLHLQVHLQCRVDLPLVEQNREYRIHKMQGQVRAASSPYMNLRSVFLRKMLKRGRYIIIPTTFHPGISCNFILRIFTDVPSDFRELRLDKPSVTCWNLLWGYPKRVSQVSVRSVEGVHPQGETEGDLYVIIKCEHKGVTSQVLQNATSAVFDMKAIFYRRRINKPIAVQVWGSKFMCDQFLGQVLLAASPNDPQEEQTLQLHNKDGREAEEMPRRVNVKVVSSDDLLEL